MSSLRVARSVLRTRPTYLAPIVQRRGYADVASDKIQLSLTLPHQVCYIPSCQAIGDDQLTLQSQSTNQPMCMSSPKLAISTSNFEGSTNIPQRAGQHPRRERRHGRPREPRPFRRAAQAWLD